MRLKDVALQGSTVQLKVSFMGLSLLFCFLRASDRGDGVPRGWPLWPCGKICKIYPLESVVMEGFHLVICALHAFRACPRLGWNSGALA